MGKVPGKEWFGHPCQSEQSLLSMELKVIETLEGRACILRDLYITSLAQNLAHKWELVEAVVKWT